MDAITELTRLDFSSIFLSVFIILVGIKAIISLFEWFIAKLGIETKWMKTKREDHELLIKTSQNLLELQKIHNDDMSKSDRHDAEIQKDLRELKSLFLSKEIDDIRWEILDFSSAIVNNRKYNREAYNHIFRQYEKYEKVLKEYIIEIGIIEESIKVIKELYHDGLNSGVIS